ncbi:branched-chain amino acid ABC transporter permease [Desulfolutivibrio sulfoxidireducens]|uniref:branched-chain amino acid ABC transporter permease n=1 Tax=Desulfolutivibrio sulfoxidireducens TaxID=2773299 RepID=UPI00159E4C5F|nr:branched-chain amino acid ABC transporter permease [Desulfolutivibrio sulfoxidireducens]QLA15596.1 branched-chain amino acid ABC transporter permease [Desulfolutivibrio sulfoxidireducens]QLA19199.1 branched-chain amino acid ABC transporter permease [Desulfolutivibrio sulfoxidireducens]
MLEQQLVNGFTLGLIYALIAVGYTMVYGVIELINFAHGEVYMFGAFLCMMFLTVFGAPLIVAVLLSMACCALMGVLLDVVAYRPLRNAPRLAALITAIGMSIFLQNLAMIIWGSRPLPFVKQALPAFFKNTALSFGDVNISWMQMAIYIAAVAMMISLNLVITRTRIGTAMRALAQNRVCASLMGINVNRVISFTFALGSGLGAMAGIMVSMFYNTMYPTMGYNAGVKAFAAAVLGGIGSVPGAMFGGIVLGIAETLGAGYVSSPYRDGVAYAVMILVIILRPSGLLGRAVTEKA